MVYQVLIPLIQECREAKDVDTQIDLLHTINDGLPQSDRIVLPSFMTDDYCRRALEMTEDKISEALKRSGHEFN